MVADAIESFNTQVKRHERDVGAPNGVVIAAVDIWRQCIFAGMTTRAVPTVVTQGNCFGERNIDANRARD